MPSSYARNAGKPWSPSEEEELLRNVQQYRGGIREIAEVHGRSAIAINLRIASIIRRMVNAEGMNRVAVGNLFFKSAEEVEEILNPSTSNNNNTTSSTKRPTVASTIQEMEHRIVSKLEHIESQLRKISKKVGVSSSSSASLKKNTNTSSSKKKKKKKTSSSWDDDDNDLI